MISYLDTNIAIFLHSGDVARLTQRATARHDQHTASRILSDLNRQIGVSVCQLPMAAVMSSALRAPLVTSDRRINEEYRNAIW